MQKQLFEYAIILQEKRNRDGDIKEEARVLVEPTWLFATDLQQATLLAGREIPEDHLGHLERITLAVRPF